MWVLKLLQGQETQKNSQRTTPDSLIRHSTYLPFSVRPLSWTPSVVFFQTTIFTSSRAWGAKGFPKQDFYLPRDTRGQSRKKNKFHWRKQGCLTESEHQSILFNTFSTGRCSPGLQAEAFPKSACSLQGLSPGKGDILTLCTYKNMWTETASK